MSQQSGPSLPRHRRKVALAASIIAACLFVAGPSAAQPAPPRIVAVGDVHGDLETFAAILREAGLIDDQRQWTGGSAVLVQTGDCLDRGEEGVAVLELLMALEPQARKAGGEVVALMGNHEAMNAMGDLRYVPPVAFDRFTDGRSVKRRESAWRSYERLAIQRSRRFQRAQLEVPAVYQLTRQQWMDAHPLGLVEYRDAFGPRGRYGRWIRSRPVIAQVGDTIFLHGGLHPEHAAGTLVEINERARDELRRFDRLAGVLVREGIALPHFSFDHMLQAGRSELLLMANDPDDDPTRRATVSYGAPAVASHEIEDLVRLGEWSILSPNGPLWFRGFALWTTDEGTAQVASLQETFGPVRFVVGHTAPDSRRITSRFDGRVFLIDTALSSAYDDGIPSALEIAGGRYTAVTLEDRRVLLEPQTAEAGANQP